MAKQVITEQQIANYLVCPVLSDKNPLPPDPELEMAEACFKWLCLELFDDRTPSLAKLRSYWDERWVDRHGGFSKSANRICRRLYDLTLGHQLLSPPSSYELVLAPATVQGDYAVLVKVNKPDQPLIVRLRKDCRPVDKQLPDLINMLRWLHFRQHEAGLPLVKVLNYTLLSDEKWTEFYDEQAVYEPVYSLMKSMHGKHLFPVTGPQCLKCDTKPCKGVFDRG